MQINLIYVTKGYLARLSSGRVGCRLSSTGQILSSSQNNLIQEAKNIISNVLCVLQRAEYCSGNYFIILLKKTGCRITVSIFFVYVLFSYILNSSTISHDSVVLYREIKWIHLFGPFCTSNANRTNLEHSWINGHKLFLIKTSNFLTKS